MVFIILIIIAKKILRKQNEINATIETNSNLKKLWNLRLGHIVDGKLIKLEKLEILFPLCLEPALICESCFKEKWLYHHLYDKGKEIRNF